MTSKLFNSTLEIRYDRGARQEPKSVSVPAGSIVPRFSELFGLLLLPWPSAKLAEPPPAIAYKVVERTSQCSQVHQKYPLIEGVLPNHTVPFKVGSRVDWSLRLHLACSELNALANQSVGRFQAPCVCRSLHFASTFCFLFFKPKSSLLEISTTSIHLNTPRDQRSPTTFVSSLRVFDYEFPIARIIKE